jgi:hypothetical protein
MRPSYEVLLGPLSSTHVAPSGGPVAVVVDREVDGPLDLARLRLVQRSRVDTGDRCTLALGLDGSAEQVFEGTVVQVRPDVSGTCVIAVGALRVLANLRVAATYTDTTLAAVVRDLAGRAGLTVAEVFAGPRLPWFVVDPMRDALAQLRGLAARFGAQVFTNRSGGLVVRPLPGAHAGGLGGGLGDLGGAADQPRFGADLIAARGTHCYPAWSAVSVGGESPASTRGVETAAWLVPDADAPSAQQGSGDRRIVIVDPLARTRGLARDIAAGTLAQGGRTARTLEVLVPGRAGVDLGDKVAVGVAAGPSPDDLLRGTGQVRRLSHRLDARTGFTTRMTMALLAAGSEVGL